VAAIVREIPQQRLVAIHAVRIIGAVFVFLYLRGELPGSFALPAGLGDSTVAITAPFVALAVARRSRGSTAALWAWNLLGTADFLSAITLGVLSSSGPLNVFHAGPPANALASLPLSLVPAFGVPLIAIVNAVSIARLVRRSPPRAPIAGGVLV
jgi:hypothetical protein